MTQAALRYAAALVQGYADPKKISAVYTIPRPKADVAKGLAGALEEGNLEGWYASLPPQTEEYRALSEAHIDYLRRAAQVKRSRSPTASRSSLESMIREFPAIAASSMQRWVICPAAA